jgi:hypothetical protein
MFPLYLNGIVYFKHGVNIDDERIVLYQLEVVQLGLTYDEMLF